MRSESVQLLVRGSGTRSTGPDDDVHSGLARESQRRFYIVRLRTVLSSRPNDRP